MKKKVVKNDFAEKYQRALADYQNLIKRNEQQRLETIAYANQELIKKLLPIVDDLQKLTQHRQETGDQIILKRFLKVLSEIGVTMLPVSPGDKFNPETMTAIEKKETQEEKKKDLVAKVFSQGFGYHQRVIRPAEVAVYHYHQQGDKNNG